MLIEEGVDGTHGSQAGDVALVVRQQRIVERRIERLEPGEAGAKARAVITDQL